jgi:hypothetical protein
MKGRKPPVTGPTRLRLYDRVRALDSDFPDCPVIVADAIAAQIDALPGEDHTPPARAYGVVVPPFRRFFVEAETTVVDGTMVQRGVLVEDISAQLRAGTLHPQHPVPPGSHWAMSMSGWFWTQGQLLTYPGVMLFHLDNDGTLLDDTKRVQIIRHADRGPRYLDIRGLVNHAPFTLKAMSAMHQRCEAEHVTPTRQQRREAERRHKASLKEYYILKVKAVQEPRAFSEVGQAQRVQGQRREHVVRGHFRWYSEEKPLFGKISGMVWIGEHRRGDDIGRIRKDYAVE